ncbi:MAG: hypothetical protein K2X47_19240 [Bdellovibrionales bacterium]|nr:hypothetical protein [Bdellovibrionales bacterium]
MLKGPGSLVGVLMLLFILVGCGTDRPFSRGVQAPVKEVADKPLPGLSRVVFEAKILPILKVSCASCHENPAPDYEKAATLVKLGNPKESKLYLNAIGGAGHGGGEIFAAGSSEESLLKEWILGTATL